VRVSARSVRLIALATVLDIAALQPAVPAAWQDQSAPAAARAPRIASYTIDARLDPGTRTITAEETIAWRNASANPAATLRFHLYYNAWRDPRSTWMRERRLAAGAPAAAVRDRDWGWIDISRVHVASGASPGRDLAPALRFVAPDDGNPDDRTVAEVPLDTPVQPGEAIAIRLAWSARVPRTFARTGAVGRYFFVAQWFPKIGVLEDAGWNCHQFHASTEFFADFGTYDVRLTVPSGWVVGATGTERRRQDNGDGTTLHQYYQEDVHDFAWTTSPDYVEATDTFTHPSLPPVRMRLLLQPEHRGQESRHFGATRTALQQYGEWFGPYPYGHVTIVDPAWQSGAGGMEYPTLFTAGTRWLAPPGTAQPESVTIHEAGHQFWYGIVASNEFEDAWLDEGLNTFATSRALAAAAVPNQAVGRYFGGFVPWVFRDLPVARDTETRSLAAYRAGAPGDAQSVPTWRYWPGTAASTTYHKTVLWLHTLERMLGWDVLQKILSTYFSRWAYRHPRPSDFFAIVNEVSGQDLTWFFDEAYRSSHVFDYGIDVFRSERRPAGGRAGGEAASSPGGYRTTVVARRYGDGVFPVDVRVVVEGGEEIRWQWDGRDRWKRFELERPARAVRADVDPDRVLLLDVKPANNSALLRPQARQAARKWSLAWLIWLQDRLLTYAFLV
jgi:hypothetical protein